MNKVSHLLLIVITYLITPATVLALEACPTGTYNSILDRCEIPADTTWTPGNITGTAVVGTYTKTKNLTGGNTLTTLWALPPGALYPKLQTFCGSNTVWGQYNHMPGQPLACGYSPNWWNQAGLVNVLNALELMDTSNPGTTEARIILWGGDSPIYPGTWTLCTLSYDDINNTVVSQSTKDCSNTNNSYFYAAGFSVPSNCTGINPPLPCGTQAAGIVPVNATLNFFNMAAYNMPYQTVNRAFTEKVDQSIFTGCAPGCVSTATTDNYKTFIYWVYSPTTGTFMPIGSYNTVETSCLCPGTVQCPTGMALTADKTMCIGPPLCPVGTVREGLYCRCTGNTDFPYTTMVSDLTVLYPKFTGDKIYAKDINNLRKYTDLRRVDAGLGGYPWTDNPLVANTIIIKAQHVNELRTAIMNVYDKCLQTRPSDHSNPNTYTITGASTVIKAQDFFDLTQAILNAK